MGVFLLCTGLIAYAVYPFSWEFYEENILFFMIPSGAMVGALIRVFVRIKNSDYKKLKMDFTYMIGPSLITVLIIYFLIS